MLTGTAAKPDEVVGRMTVTIHQEKLEYTVEKVAVNAVMAGAGPEHLPVILALAASEEASLPSSTTSFARMAVVNGPIREEIGMNSGLGALSPFNHANSVIGRAWTLMSINLADARPGDTFMGSLGNNVNYNNMSFAENEERSVWEPFHVTEGLQEGREHGEPLPGLERDQQHGRRGMLPSRSGGDAHHHAGLPLPEGGHHAGDGPSDGQASEGAGIRRSGQALPLPIGELPDDRRPVLGLGRRLLAGGAQRAQRRGAVRLLAEAAPRRHDQAVLRSGPINVVVVGGETQAMWLTTDMWHTKTVSIDKWRPASGVYEEDEQTARRRAARQKRHAAALSRSGYDL